MSSQANIPKSKAIFSVLRLRLIAAGLLLLTACAEGPGRQEGGPDPRFRTTSPSRLYFRNLRSSAYTQSRESGTDIDLYRLRQWSDLQPSPLIIPVIADNWLQDEAFLRLQFARSASPLSDTLRVIWTSPIDSGRHQLNGRSALAQLEFGRLLATSLQAGHQLRLEGPRGEKLPVLDRPTERKLFLQTMRDYLGLIEADRK